MNYGQETIFVYDPQKRIQRSDPLREYLHTKQDHQAETKTSRFNEIFTGLQDILRDYARENTENIKSELISWISTQVPESVQGSILLNVNPSILKDLNPDRWVVASTFSNESPNLKTVIKNVVNRLTSRASDLDTDRRLLYDFDVLKRWIQDKSPDTKFIICIEEAGAFPPQIINDLIRYMHTYVDELPLHIVLHLTMPPEIFEERMSREIMSKFECRVFEPFGARQVVSKCLDYLKTVGVYIGKDLELLLLQETPEQLERVLKYFLLSHFASNPLSLLTKDNVENYLSIIKRLPSLRDHVRHTGEESLLNDSNLKELCVSLLTKVQEGEDLGILSPIVINDTGLYHTVFNPNYRYAQEVALSTPDAIGLCDSDFVSSIPVCLLYQIIRESELYVNIYDTYTSFRDRVDRPENIDSSEWPNVAMAWFLQGIAELKQMGVIKDCKRKFECVGKVAWKGV